MLSPVPKWTFCTWGRERITAAYLVLSHQMLEPQKWP